MTDLSTRDSDALILGVDDPNETLLHAMSSDPKDNDGTDGKEGDGADGDGTDGTDGDAADGDGTDGTDGDGTDGKH